MAAWFHMLPAYTVWEDGICAYRGEEGNSAGECFDHSSKAATLYSCEELHQSFPFKTKYNGNKLYEIYIGLLTCSFNCVINII